MEWNAAAPGRKKYGKDMLKWMAPCIGSAHKVYRNYFWADTVLDVVLN
jgi:hypothetical protein